MEPIRGDLRATATIRSISLGTTRLVRRDSHLELHKIYLSCFTIFVVNRCPVPERNPSRSRISAIWRSPVSVAKARNRARAAGSVRRTSQERCGRGILRTVQASVCQRIDTSIVVSARVRQTSLIKTCDQLFTIDMSCRRGLPQRRQVLRQRQDPGALPGVHQAERRRGPGGRFPLQALHLGQLRLPIPLQLSARPGGSPDRPPETGGGPTPPRTAPAPRSIPTGGPPGGPVAPSVRWPPSTPRAGPVAWPPGRCGPPPHRSGRRGAIGTSSPRAAYGADYIHTRGSCRHSM